jgi:hypothetical protein
MHNLVCTMCLISAPIVGVKKYFYVYASMLNYSLGCHHDSAYQYHVNSLSLISNYEEDLICMQTIRIFGDLGNNNNLYIMVQQILI